MASDMKTKTTTSNTTITKKEDRKPPKGATIIEQEERITTEEIENGWLLTKNFSGRYTTDKEKDSYGSYYDYSKKWYSKDDPLTVTVNDEALADAFED